VLIKLPILGFIMTKHVQTEFKAPYYTFGELTSSTPAIWIACHGYGQLGEFFMKKLETFAELGHHGIVLQGLHKFYYTQERVGASWMTKHDREVDLLNQRTYFSRVFEAEYGGLKLSDFQVNLIGFSQGVSAISRLLFHLKLPCDNLVFWAGGFPPELPGSEISFLKKDYKLIVAIGDKDQYYNEENYMKNIEYIRATFNREQEVHIYPGRHTVDTNLLKKLITD
jgi:predicted esterase